MSTSPALAENLARAVLERYAEAERALLKRMALYLKVGTDAPDWVERKLAQLTAYRKQVEAVIAKLQAETAAGVSQALHEAYARGGSAAVAELTGLSLPAETEVIGTHALEALIAETQEALAGTHQRILRTALDAYRSVVAETAEKVLLGTETRRQAAQAALDRFARKGITGFIDKAGRGWSLEAYTEMAMRTGTAHAAVQGQTDRLEANGMDLVIISDAPRECPLCRPHEGKVYSISGRDPKYPPLQEARGGGLWHPGCRHSASAYFPGVTRRPKGPTADPEGYEAGQKQRYLERQVRAQKRLEAAALDDTAKRKAQAKIRDYQKQLREHVEAHDLKRLPYREQIGKAH